MLRGGMAIILAGLLGAPLSAQQAMLRVPPPEPATKGEQVVVTLRDGRTIEGRVGPLIGDGFSLAPTSEAPYFVRFVEVVTIRDATTGRTLANPSAPKWSHGRKVFLGVVLAVGVPALIMGLVCGGFGSQAKRCP